MRRMAVMSELHRFLDDARGLLPAAVALRRRIHAEPELGLDLPLTTAAVLDGLQGLDVEIARGPSTSGLVVSLAGTKPGTQTGRTILLRGDMDALPMPEETGLEFASEFAGRCMPAAMTLIRRCWCRPCTCCTVTATNSPALSNSCSSPARKAMRGPG